MTTVKLTHLHEYVEIKAQILALQNQLAEHQDQALADFKCLNVKTFSIHAKIPGDDLFAVVSLGSTPKVYDLPKWLSDLKDKFDKEKKVWITKYGVNRVIGGGVPNLRVSFK